ncbi:MAG: beta-ketoacyl synthase N-terminal-like domain-containing protein, partial [Bacteroidota bacterium]
HRVVTGFLKDIPAHRQYRLRYEDLVQAPEASMRQLCEQLGLTYHPNLARPYEQLDQKMTDGLYADSKPMGDPKLLQHKKIDPKLADAWKGVQQDNFLHARSWQLAHNFNYPSIEAPTGQPQKMETRASTNDIAIIGMACRYPGAANLQRFWSNLVEAKDVSRTIGAEELLADGLDPALLEDPNFVNRGMWLDDSDKFDAGFFGYLPKEAALMDPQHRVYLEVAYAALEDAGIDPLRYREDVGIMGGVARNTYLVNNVLTHPNYFASLDDFQIGIALEKDFPATRVAYQLNLNGPAVNVQTACSTSGVALHLACQTLLANDASVMLVGGGRIQPPVSGGHQHKEGHALSPDGYCRAFDADAQGMVRGHGMGFLVLKKLGRAIADGDQIHAVIKATAISNDGSDKIGFTAPSVSGQAKTIAKVYEKAGIDPASLSYVECHGTGTRIGDPIEIAGLTRAFQQYTSEKQFCAIGSVKTNIGHLDAGACVAGIIKTVLALKHQQLPGTMHFRQPNPQIAFEQTPFFVNAALRPWPKTDQPRRAAVSSFGLGGTNAHVLLEEAPTFVKSDDAPSHHLLLLSAKEETALAKAAENLVQQLATQQKINLTDIAYTLQTGRQQFAERQFMVLDGNTLLEEPLDSYQATAPTQDRKVAFLFPGGGAQHSNMGRQLYTQEPVFRDTVDLCLNLLLAEHQLDLR